MYLCAVDENKQIILFDGVCNLCNNFIQFIIQRDTEDIFRYASLQSEVAQKLIAERGIKVNTMESVILINPGIAYYTKSDAAVHIGKHLKGYRYISKIITLVPSSLRNIVYDLIARNRYRWYGKMDACMTPTSESKGKFLD